MRSYEINQEFMKLFWFNFGQVDARSLAEARHTMVGVFLLYLFFDLHVLSIFSLSVFYSY